MTALCYACTSRPALRDDLCAACLGELPAHRLIGKRVDIVSCGWRRQAVLAAIADSYAVVWVLRPVHFHWVPVADVVDADLCVRGCGRPSRSRGALTCAHCPPANCKGIGTPLVDNLTPYRDDVAAQLFVQTFGAEATLDHVALAIGVTRERVRQIEADALGRMEKRLRLVGIGRDDVLRFLTTRRAHHALEEVG